MVRLNDLNALLNLPNLTHLNLKRCSSVSSLDGLEQCTLLTDLTLSGCRKLESLDAISQLPDLEKLDLSQIPSVDLSPLLRMPALKLLKLDARRNKDDEIIAELSQKIEIQ